jgi:hypothetical protein
MLICKISIIKPQTAIRTSLSNYRKEDWMTNVPLYIIGNYLNN